MVYIILFIAIRQWLLVAAETEADKKHGSKYSLQLVVRWALTTHYTYATRTRREFQQVHTHTMLKDDTRARAADVAESMSSTPASGSHQKKKNGGRSILELRRRQRKRQLLFALERTSRLEDDVGIQHQVEEKWQRFE
mmetsp:Transcript_8099/g.14713  ORF Transcript_8099/g.14713 Transcript_8099/m.14713 type:complete len:138 (+) Transcript_8099:99-512(+)